MKTKEKVTNKIKKADLVKVIAGNQKGLIGKIISINRKKNTAILDTGKFRKKFAKRNKEDLEKGKDQNEKKGEVLIPISIHLSNLMIWDESSNRVTRIGFLLNEPKQRYLKKSLNFIEEKKYNE